MKVRLFILLATVGLGSPIAMGQDCPTTSAPSEVETRLSNAETALKTLDIEAFSLAMEETTIMLPCLDGMPAVALAAKLHRLRGIELYTAGKMDLARQALRAAKVLEPDFTFSAGTFPKGHALVDFYAAISVNNSAETRQAPAHIGAPVPRDAKVAFDGRFTLERPSDRATVFQHLSPSEVVLTTRYLLPKDPLPTYASIPRQRNRLIIASIASGVIAGGSYALGWQSRQQFLADDPTRTSAELESLKRRANTSFVISGLGTTLTVVGASGAVLIGPR